jgi:hypothetical protein
MKGQRPSFAPLISVSSGLRDQARTLFVSESRRVADHLPSRRGSILARLLAEAKASFLRDDGGQRAAFNEQYSEAVESLRTEEVQAIEASVAETARRMLGFRGSTKTSGLSVEFGFADPGNPHSSLRLLCRQGNMLIPAELMGAGEQSALVVGLFETFRQQRASLGTILMEEPEMYLHPQAQRYLQKILVDLVDQSGAQIVLTTHSTVFADMCRFRDIRLFRKPAGRSNVCRITDPADLSFLDDQLQREKLTQYVDADTGEILFANGVLLVEGHGDRLAALEVAERLDCDLDAEGLSVIDCGGKSAIPFFARLCRSLQIPFAVLHDSDFYDPAKYKENLVTWMQAENQVSPRKNQTILDACAGAGQVFVIESNLEYALGISRNASDKPKRVMAEIKGRTTEDLPGPLVDAVKALVAMAPGAVGAATTAQA